MHNISTYIVGSGDLNEHGVLFGGKTLSLLDLAGRDHIRNSLKSTGQIVTRKVTDVLFDAPINVGDKIELYANIEHIGNSSASVKLEVRRDSSVLITGTIVYVHLLDGKPSHIVSI